MSLFGGQTNKHTLASLDQLGTTAAIYPSEDSLWRYGPPINDPGDQNVALLNTEVDGGQGTPVIVPHSAAEAQREEDWIHETMNGPTPNGAYEEEWVNLSIGGPAGYGNYNEQPYYSGHSQIVQANPAAEQGWGVGPARRWAHYPFSQLDNPRRNQFIALRNGQLPWETASSDYYMRTQMAWEQQWAPYKQRGPVAPVVQVAESVPFVNTVPTYGGGISGHPGLDFLPPLPQLDGGIY